MHINIKRRIKPDINYKLICIIIIWDCKCLLYNNNINPETFKNYRDRIRSAANAVSHTYCAAFTYYACKKKIEAWNDDENPFEGVQEEKFNGEIINTEFKPRELVIVNKRPYTVKTTGNQFDNTFM